MLSSLPYLVIKMYDQEIFIVNFHNLNVRFCEMMIIMRIYRYEKYKKVFDSEVTKEFCSIIITVFAMIFIFACMLQVIIQFDEVNRSEHGVFDIHGYVNGIPQQPLDQYIYFVMICISTVGYGNNYTTDQAKMCILVIIIMTIFIIPSKISKLSDIMQSKSEYARFNYKVVESTPFIILLGTMS